ncbi:hypothetical protein [Francisella sp. SYW-9]|uniref:hypothetical protein n=1 Tax=Francisella sp. SYW-9 TaxID=2610888 RepID=UPI00123C7DA3|nr:hypothetical protein [Francisella sp. SYW-9]
MIFNKTRSKEIEAKLNYFKEAKEDIESNLCKLQKEHNTAIKEIESLKSELSTQKDTLIAKFKKLYQEKLIKATEESKKLYKEAVIGREEDKKKINNLIRGIKLQKHKKASIDTLELKKANNELKKANNELKNKLMKVEKNRNELEKALNKKRLTKEQNKKKQDLLKLRRR